MFSVWVNVPLNIITFNLASVTSDLLIEALIEVFQSSFVRQIAVKHKKVILNGLISCPSCFRCVQDTSGSTGAHILSKKSALLDASMIDKT